MNINYMALIYGIILLTGHGNLVPMAPARTTVSKTLQPGIARIQQMPQPLSQPATTTPLAQQQYQSQISKKSFSTQEPSSRWSNVPYAQQPSIAEQKQRLVEQYRMKQLPYAPVGKKQQNLEIPTPEQLEADIKQALIDRNAWKIMERAELAMVYMLSGDIDPISMKEAAQKAIKKIDQFREDFYNPATKAVLMGSLVSSFAILAASSDVIQAMVPLATSALIAIGAPRANNAIMTAFLGNAKAAAQELLKITAKAQEILNEQDNQKSYEDVD
jgi:hypothetical protein